MTFDEMILDAPKKPGIYRMFDSEGGLLYVGKAKNILGRLKQYRDGEKLEYHKIIMRRQVVKVEWTETATESDALVLEQHLIKTEKPKYNVILKDDKMYPFLALSRDEFPRLYKFRDKITPKRDVYGPFPFVKDLNDTIKLIQKVCRVRTCTNSFMDVHVRMGRPCLFYQTGLCTAPCVLAQPDYKNQLKMARNILRGHIRLVVSDLTKKMKAAAAIHDFELAAKLRNRIESLQSTCAAAVRTGKIKKPRSGKK